MQSQPTEKLSGHNLGGYDIGPFIGGGGMGEVYVAYDPSLDRRVAVKVLKRAFADDENFIKRFQREARAAAKLSHPNIVQVHAVDIGAKPPYMVMEFVEGQSLEQIIAPQTPVPWQRALEIVEQCALALQCAHDGGVIHRDIKPGNILLEASGRVRVTDFGIAKVLGANTQLTQDAISVGSPSYMSPEQCGVGEVVPASDIFALGITLFEMLTGSLPFNAETNLGLIKQITTDPLPQVRQLNSSVPGELQYVLEAMVAKQPESRYPRAEMLAEDARALRQNQHPRHLRLPDVPAPRGATDIVPSHTAMVAAGNPEQTRSLVDALLDGHATPRGAAGGYASQQSSNWPRYAAMAAGILMVVAGAALMWNRNPGPPPDAPPPERTSEAIPEPVAPTPDTTEREPLATTTPASAQQQSPPPGFPQPPPGAPYPPPRQGQGIGHIGPNGEWVPGPPPHHRPGFRGNPPPRPQPRPSQQQ